MAQFPLTKTLTSITVTRHDGEYQLQRFFSIRRFEVKRFQAFHVPDV